MGTARTIPVWEDIDARTRAWWSEEPGPADCDVVVVGAGIRLRDIAVEAAATGSELPPRYAAHLGAWAALGVPALISFLTIFYMMVSRQVPFVD